MLFYGDRISAGPFPGWLEPTSQTLFYRVGVNEVLVAQIKPAIADHRMSPDAALRISNRRLRVEFEPAFFVPSVGRRIDHHDRAVILLQAIELAVGVGDRPF